MFLSQFAQFQNRRSGKRPVFVARAPGRLDLMGGNGDYSGGLVLQCATREATWAAVRRRDDEKIVFHNPQLAAYGMRTQVELSLCDLHDAERIRKLANTSSDLRWIAYVAGTFCCLQSTFPKKLNSGAEIFIHSEVPMNRGAGSSAAVSVAVMKAAAAAYSLPLQGVRLAEACQWVENFIASSACGLMDQIAVVLARRNFVVPMLCQPCIVQKPIRIPSAIRFWGIDSGAKRSIASPAYESARAASFMGYKLICEMEGLDTRLDCSGLIPRWTDDRWNGYLAQIPAPLFYSKFEKQLPAHMRGGEYISSKRVHPDPFTRVAPEVIYPVRACTRYAIEEHQRVNAFLNLLQNPLQFERLGELMYQSHFAYTECGLGHPATDLIVDLVRQEGPRSGLAGARVSGGGAGGTVVVLGRTDAGSAIQRVAGRFAAQQGYRPHVFDGSSLGADAFGVQVHLV